MSGVLGPIDSKSLGPAFVTPQHAKRIGVCNQLESGKDSSNDGVCDNIKLESGSDYFFSMAQSKTKSLLSYMARKV